MTFLIFSFTVCLYCIILNKFFIAFNLCKINYKGQSVPYSGGTVIFISILSGFILFLNNGEISPIKMIFFSIVVALVYMVGILDDLLGSHDVKGLKGNISALVSKKISTGIIKAVLIVLIACYIYYFFNEEYWVLKGLITALISNLFNLLDLRPGRCIKAYYPFFIFFSMFNIRWTKELFIIFSFSITLYYIWDAYSFSMLGDSGSNLIGFIVGLVISEIIGTDLYGLIVLLSILILLQLFLDKYSLTKIIKGNPVLDYIDRFLTERQAVENVESRKRKSY